MARNPRKPQPRPRNTPPISCTGQELEPGSDSLSIIKRDSAPETGKQETGKVEIVASSSLSFRQQAALPIIASSPTLAQAALDSGVGESTLRRWLANPAFGEQLNIMRRESAQLARQELNALMPLCSAVFADALQGPDPNLRLRAARYALSFMARFGEMERLSDDLRALEAASHLPTPPSQ